MRVLRTYWPILLPLVASLIVAFVYGKHFGWSIHPTETNEKAYSAFGQFGDYFGGMLNPLLAFFNITLIVYYQKTSIAKSADKDVIFRMLELQSKIVAGFELRTKYKPQSGQNKNNNDENTLRFDQNDSDYEEVNTALRSFWVFDKEIKTRYQRMLDSKEPRNSSPSQMSPEQRLEILRDAYDKYYHGNFRKQYLGHYFRNLYLIFKTIDESEAFSRKEKLQYTKIVRAQMSHLEMKLLYLNCKISDGAPFKKYVARYKILEWINDNDFSNYDRAFKNSEVIKRDILSWTDDS